MDFERLRRSPPNFLGLVAQYKPDRLLPDSEWLQGLLPALANTAATQDWTSGAKFLDAALSKAATPGDAAYVLACKALYLGVQDRLEDAADVADAAAELAPHASVIEEIRARSLLRAARFEDAVASYRRAVELDDANGPAWAALAVLHALGADWATVETAAAKAQAQGAEISGLLVRLSRLFAHVERTGTTGDALWSKALTEAPDLDAALTLLPPVEGAWPDAADGRPVLLAACDPGYLRDHALTLIWSLEALEWPVDLHLHLYDAGEMELALVETQASRCRSVRLTWTRETTDPARFPDRRAYYSSARFCRAAELARCCASAVIIVDTDALFRQRVDTLLAAVPPGADAALPVHADSPPWNRYAAGCVLVTPTATGRLFLNRVAAIVAHNLAGRTATWFIDQIALCLAAEHVADPPSLAPLALQRFCDTEHRPDATLWVVTTHKASDGPYGRYREELAARFGGA